MKKKSWQVKSLPFYPKLNGLGKMPHVFGSWSSCIHSTCLLSLPIVAPQQLQARLLNPIPKQPATGAERESRKCLVCWNAISSQFYSFTGRDKEQSSSRKPTPLAFLLGFEAAALEKVPTKDFDCIPRSKIWRKLRESAYARCHLKDYHVHTNLDWYNPSFSMFCIEFWLALLSKNVISQSTYLTAGVRIHLQLAAKEAASFSMFSW